jgi:ADP-heptose:LPS heptosyltransferase
MRILFIASSRIGDAILCAGLLDHLIRAYPDSEVTVVTGPVAEDVFARMPNKTRTIVMEKRRFGAHWLRLWALTATTRWDLVVDIRASAIAWLLLAKRRAIMRRRPGHKTAQIGAILGLDPPPMPVAWTDDSDRAVAETLLPAGPPIIALAPTANWIGKVWPAERFVALARALTEGPMRGARIAVLAGPGAQERAMAAPVLAALPEAIDLCGRLTLPQAAACLMRADLFIGNDSGLMHLAAAAGTPTLGLFGPTPPEEYGPAGRRAAFARASSPAMTDLSVADALAAAGGLIALDRAA